MNPLDLSYEKRLLTKGYRVIAGIDEVGRGAIAGPVVAAAVILPQDLPFHKYLKDSKAVEEKKRKQVVQWLLKEGRISFGLGFSFVEEIERINIHGSCLLAMRRAISCLEERPDILLVDGIFSPPHLSIPSLTIVGGDAKVASIAAASLVAKVSRDGWMVKLSSLYPEYGWEKNKGYGTANHFESLRTKGLSPYHRKSFLVKRLHLAKSLNYEMDLYSELDKEKKFF
ncbi:ribonuclease HII [Candidatus Methylacidiphilum infernorum]|uniref:Ribonuclease HII n=1 Tax=Methylacidiphilum infernorum (isolate V4) TaxID=481448 RepID=B3DVH3_METI4|nr:ribonuclease HII [Candidatus Methylacidiphilum infernorum]ACD83326.1 Ribonuclease HII [Methylacidiphilum infernorum V4]